MVFNPYGIGDVLFSLPLVIALRQRQRVSFLAYVCNKRSAQVLENNPYINEIIVYERDELKGRWRKQLQFFNKLRTVKADLAIDLTLNRNLSFLLFLAGIKIRVGLDYKGRGIFLSRRKKITEFTKHVAEEYFDLYYLICEDARFIRAADYYPQIYLTEKEKRFSQLLFYNLGLRDDNIVVSVFPGGGASWGKDRQRKHWPGEKFLELILQTLVLDNRIIVMVMGDEADRDAMTIPRDLLRSRRCFDLRGKLTLRETISIVKAAKLAITNDGGPAHIAAAVGTRLVSIMGPVPEKIYSPFALPKKIRIITKDVPCRPCYRAFRMPKCQRDFQCLGQISVDEVLDAVKAALKL